MVVIVVVSNRPHAGFSEDDFAERGCECNTDGYIYIYIYIYVFVYLYIYIYIYITIYIYIYTYIYVYIHTCVVAASGAPSHAQESGDSALQFGPANTAAAERSAQYYT